MDIVTFNNMSNISNVSEPILSTSPFVSMDHTVCFFSMNLYLCVIGFFFGIVFPQYAFRVLGRFLLISIYGFDVDTDSMKYFERKLVHEKKHLVGLFPHTSLLDSVLMMLTFMAVSPNVKHMKSLMTERWAKRSFFKWFSHLFDDCIISVEDGTGGVASIVRQVQQTTTENFNDAAICIYINPEGSTSAKPWRKGWWNIASQLDADIVVCGPDFKRCEFRCLPLGSVQKWIPSTSLNHQEEEKEHKEHKESSNQNNYLFWMDGTSYSSKELETYLQAHEFSRITPLYPQRSIPHQQLTGVKKFRFNPFNLYSWIPNLYVYHAIIFTTIYYVGWFDVFMFRLGAMTLSSLVERSVRLFNFSSSKKKE